METLLSRCCNSSISNHISQLKRQFLGLGLLLLLSGGAFSQQPNPLHEHAEVYVDQYFEPTKDQMLSPKGVNKSAALGHFAIGRLQENQDQTELAMNSYLKVLELEPGNIELANETAIMLARAGRQKQAQKLLESALKSSPDEAYPFVVLSKFLSSYHGNNQDNKERALELAQEAVEKFPFDPLAYEHLSEMYRLGKRRNDAQKVLTKALEVDSKDPVFWLRLGKAASKVWPIRLKSEDNSKEISILNKFYNRANDFAGNDDAVLISSADFYASTQQYEKAEEIYSSVVKRLTNRLDIRKKLASIYKINKDNENYIKVLNSIIKIDPGDSHVHRELSAAYRQEKKKELAIKHMRTALKLGKGSVEEYIELSREMAVHSGEIAKAGDKVKAKQFREDTIKFIRDAAYLFPNTPDFHLLVTYPLRNLDRYKEALKHLEQYEEIARKENAGLLNEYFYFDFGAISEQNGDIDRATKHFKKCIEIMSRRSPQPDDDRSKAFSAQVYNYLGYMWLENDMHIPQAGEFIETAVELDPSSAAIADSLGWYYFKVAEYEKALKELLRSEKLFEKDPDFENPDPVILDHIGRAYFELDKFDKAIEYMEKCIKFDEEKKQEYKERLEKFKKGKVADKPKD